MYELGREGLNIPPQTPVYISDANLGSQQFAYLGNADQRLSPSSTGQRSKTKKKRSKHRSTKSHRRRHKKTQVGAYVLQLIGLLCLILAAIKSFEPLTGVGFTLIMIGYNNKKLRNSVVDDLLKGKKMRRKTKDGDRKKERRKEKKEIEVLEFESDTCVDDT